MEEFAFQFCMHKMNLMIKNLQKQGIIWENNLRWRPILTPEDVLISIVSILSEPNINSPANVDAGIQFRDRPDEYKKKVRKLIDKALENLWLLIYLLKKWIRNSN